MHPLPHHTSHFCEPLEARIAPAALSVFAAGPGVETEGDGGTANALPAPNPGSVTFTVTLDAPQTGPVAVDFFTSDGTATAGADYAHTAGRLDFAPGETSKTVQVPVLDDVVAESDEEFVLHLANPAGATLANATASATIWDNDTLVFIAGQEVTEGDNAGRSALFTFALGSALAHPVSVSFSTQDIAATAGLDYLPVSGVITFLPGETAKVVVVSILGDKLDEYAEEFSLIAGSLSGARFGGGLPMRILDDDSKPDLSIADAEVVEGESGLAVVSMVVSLDAPSGKTVTVNYSTGGGGSATPVSDFAPSAGTLVFEPGETSKAITLSVVGDTDPELDETFEVTLSSAVNADIEHGRAKVTIFSDDSVVPPPVLSIADATVVEGDTGERDAEFTVTLSAPSTRTITVAYSTIAGTAAEGDDYDGKSGVLTFTPGQTSRIIRVEVDGDLKLEGDETFTVALAAPVNATLGDAEGNCTIVNDDVPALPAISIGDATIVEGTGAASRMAFVITLGKYSASGVSVAFSTVAGTATPGVDFVPTTGTTTFAPGERTATIFVTIIGDSVVEGDETFDVQLTAAVNGVLEKPTALATIVDDDARPAAPTGFFVTPRLARWIDVDGDTVSVGSSLPILSPSLFNFDANGELALLDLATARFAGASLDFKVTRARSGDGSVNIGAIESPGRDLGVITVKGSLDRIVAGDSNMRTPGLRGLIVETLGLLPGESSPASMRSDISGTFVRLVVRKSFNGAAVYASGPGAGIRTALIIGDMSATADATDTGFHADGVIGTVQVTGSVTGADVHHPMQIFATGPAAPGNAIHNVIVRGGMQFAQIIAGYGASPLAIAGWTSIGTVKVAGAILASTIAAGVSPDAGGFFDSTDFSPLPGGDGRFARIARVIAGTALAGVINGTPEEINASDQFGIFARTITTVRIGGKALPLQRASQDNYAMGTTGDVMCREI
jgi:Calx-beta domain